MGEGGDRSGEVGGSCVCRILSERELALLGTQVSSLASLHDENSMNYA